MPRSFYNRQLDKSNKGAPGEPPVQVGGSIGAAGAICIGLLGAILTTLLGARIFPITEAYEPVVRSVWIPAVALLFVAIAVETLWYIGWVRSNRAVHCAHLVTMFAVAVILARSFWQLDSIKDDLAAARAAEFACLEARSSAIDEAKKQQASARYVLKTCQQDYEDKKTIFTSTTLETHCKVPLRSADVAAQQLRDATAKTCAATGSLPLRSPAF